MTFLCRYAPVLEKLFAPLRGPIQREQNRVRAAILRIDGLMPLLMKQRNGIRWTADERAQLSHHLRNLISLSPYLAVFLVPGSFVLFSVVAWWLDRRRQKRREEQAGASRSTKASQTHP